MQLYCFVSNARVPIRLFGEGASSSWSDGTYEPFLEIKFQMERKHCRKKELTASSHYWYRDDTGNCY